MTSEKTLRFALFACLALSLAIYHVIQLLLPATSLPGWHDLMKIAQISVTAVLFVYFLYWPPVIKLLLLERYIAGTYIGRSRRVEPRPGDERVGDEDFIIEQNLFQAELTGSSTIAGELQSSRVGRLYRVDGFKYWFAVDLTFKQAEVGILEITLRNSTVNGFYKSADPGFPYAFAITATRQT